MRGLVGIPSPAMARPVTYTARIDTKVRLRLDHRDRIQVELDSGRWGSRNALLEAALDAFFGTKRPKTPRMPKADPAAVIQPGKPMGGGKSPRVRNVAEEQAAASEAAVPAPPIVESRQKTRVQPRARRVVR